MVATSVGGMMACGDWSSEWARAASNSQQLRVPLRAELAASSGRCVGKLKVKTYRHEYYMIHHFV